MRRTTLGPISSSQANSRASLLEKSSSIAAAAAAHNGKLTKRSTLVPKPQLNRQSVGPGYMKHPAPNKTSSSARVSISNNRMSMSRRSSSINNRRSSTVNGGGGRGTRQADPRPITDKAFMNSCIRSLIRFLSERSYDHVLSPKLLSRPTKKDFTNIIYFLFQHYDRNFAFGSGKFEEEVTTWYRNVKYPFSISKTALVAVGSPHTWPALLASIAWIIELLEYDEKVQIEAEEFDEETGNKAFIDYLGNAYRSFLAGDDHHYNLLEQDLSQRLESRNATIQEEVTSLQEKNAQLKILINAAKSKQSSIPTLNSKKRDYASDLEKFQKLISQLNSQKDSFQQKIKNREEELDNECQKHLKYKKDICDLEARIESQELSADDISHMGKERSRLQEQIQQILITQKDLQNSIWQKEQSIQEHIDKLEDDIKAYSVIATRLKLLPRHAKNANNSNFEIRLNLEKYGMNATIELSIHLKKVIRPALSAFRKNRLERMNLALDEALELQTEIEVFTDYIKKENDSVKLLENRLQKVEDQFKREKDMHDTMLAKKSAEMEDTELYIEQLNNSRNFSPANSKTELAVCEMQTKLEESEKINKQRIKQLKKDITSILFLCTDHKDAVEKDLSALINYFHSQQHNTSTA